MTFISAIFHAFTEPIFSLKFFKYSKHMVNLGTIVTYILRLPFHVRFTLFFVFPALEKARLVSVQTSIEVVFGSLRGNVSHFMERHIHQHLQKFQHMKNCTRRPRPHCHLHPLLTHITVIIYFHYYPYQNLAY